MHRRAFLAASAAAGIVRVAHAASAGPVVLELFTSQGCSDCPPADTLLGELARRPGIIALAWHVDYWDRLGWPDPFASRTATDRQQAYATRLGTEVFTPALVVDGTRMLVGSDRSAVNAAISGAAPLPVPVSIDGPVARTGAAGAPVTALFVAWDPMEETPVHAGENEGRRLREFCIVRTSKVLAEWDGSPREIVLPPAQPGQGGAVLLQARDLRILGAASIRPAPIG